MDTNCNCRICQGVSWGDVHQEIIKNINDIGWQIIFVSGTDAQPSYAYTVGLAHNFNHPELIVFGLPYQISMSLLNNAGGIAKNNPIKTFTRYQNIVSGLDCIFADDNSFNFLMSLSFWFYEKEIPVFILVWPDENNLFPKQPGFNSKFIRMQPVSYKSSRILDL